MRPAQLGHRHAALACRSIAMICTSVYLLVFIRNFLMHPGEKILLMQRLTFGGITGASIIQRKSVKNHSLRRNLPFCIQVQKTLRRWITHLWKCV
jgi:hypothetical protein